ncbi:MAG: ATP-binding protein, partial [Anaerolineales bacterium]|nr:ATP-binding protein [Anaerolineales bacterium]
MVEQEKYENAKIQASEQSNAVGSISVGGDVSGNIHVGNVGYSSDEVSKLLVQISSTFQAKAFDGKCPYKGLDVFEEGDTELFFGREMLAEELVRRVEASRTVFITGPSGSGKSSLVRAGLLPSLKQGSIKGSEQWLYATMKPGRDPIRELGRVLASLAGTTNAEDEIRAKALSDESIFARWAEIVLKDGRDKRLALFIDQFEEVFTQISHEEERIAFLNLLTHAADAENGRVILLFSMRSDFVPNCAVYPELNATLNQQFIQIGAMQPEELVSAIAQPALRVGLRIDPDLIAQIINDMKGEPGALPLMQFALKDLFDSLQEKGGIHALTLNDYLQRGGIQKSLERHADAAFAHLSEHEKELTRSIFSGLIEVGRGTQDTRRTAIFDELVPSSTNVEEVEIIVQKLADARLITTDESAGKDTVTISHEKLIDAWPWLKRLVNENRDVIALQNEIAGDAKEWEEHKRDGSYLYSGARLINANEQLKANKLSLSGITFEYIRAGQARNRKSQVIWAGSLTLAFIILISAVIIFANLTQEAQNKAANAQALQLGFQSEGLL